MSSTKISCLNFPRSASSNDMRIANNPGGSGAEKLSVLGMENLLRSIAKRAIFFSLLSAITRCGRDSLPCTCSRSLQLPLALALVSPNLQRPSPLPDHTSTAVSRRQAQDNVPCFQQDLDVPPTSCLSSFHRLSTLQVDRLKDHHSLEQQGCGDREADLDGRVRGITEEKQSTASGGMKLLDLKAVGVSGSEQEA